MTTGIRRFFFDTAVYDVDFSSRNLQGGGGTEFCIIESKIQELVRNGFSYPDVVMVITDGEGGKVNPEFPERWHWFLTDDGIKEYVPNGSRIHYLSQVES